MGKFTELNRCFQLDALVEFRHPLTQSSYPDLNTHSCMLYPISLFKFLLKKYTFTVCPSEKWKSPTYFLQHSWHDIASSMFTEYMYNYLIVSRFRPFIFYICHVRSTWLVANLIGILLLSHMFTIIFCGWFWFTHSEYFL